MTKFSLKRLVLAGLFAAAITVSTLISIPLPNGGYANLGDCFVLISGIFLGPVYGALAAGIGSALADLALGYFTYAPVTFIIKGLMALVIWLIAGKLAKFAILKFAVGTVGCEVLMVGGYLIYELILYGAGAVANLPFNALQGVVGAVSATIVFAVLFKTKLLFKLNK